MTKISSHIDNEITNARKVYKQGIAVVRNKLVEVSKNKTNNVHELLELLDDIIESLEHNPHALLCLCKNKHPEDYLPYHSLNCGILASAFAMSLEWESDRVKAVALGALLADVGKFCIPQDILDKPPKKLSDKENAMIQNHVKVSHAIAQHIEGLPEASLQAIVEHHENLDGSGYPAGRKGEELSDEGKLVRIVDCYETLTSERYGVVPEEPTDALKKMMSWTGTRLDKSLMQQFIQLLGIYPVGSMVVLNNGILSVVIEQNSDSLLQPVVRTLYDIKKKVRLTEQEDLSLADEGLKILTHTQRNQFKLNPLSAIG